LDESDHEHDSVSHQQAWNRFMDAERRDLENRRNGQLRKLLGYPLPGESPEELERLVREDEARADEGLVELRHPNGEITYKHIDDLIPEDRTARVASEGARVEWFAQRSRTRDSS
jgi:hypothetical protein